MKAPVRTCRGALSCTVRSLLTQHLLFPSVRNGRMALPTVDVVSCPLLLRPCGWASRVCRPAAFGPTQASELGAFTCHGRSRHLSLGAAPCGAAFCVWAQLAPCGSWVGFPCGTNAPARSHGLSAGLGDPRTRRRAQWVLQFGLEFGAVLEACWRRCC